MAVSITQVAFEHHRQALGIAETKPRISWRFAGNATEWEQSAYDLEIMRGQGGRSHTYSLSSPESVLLPWPEAPLTATERARVRARAHGQEGQSSTPWSEWVTVETGLLSSEDWSGAVTIGADYEVELNKPKRPVLFRKAFDVESDIASARLYITALGLYEAEINGNRVGDRVLAPGWQSYYYRHVYDTYDVTDLVKSGQNAIGVTVGEGWYAGRIGFNDARNVWGDTLGLLALLAVTRHDGSTVHTRTDLSWKSSLSPIQTSEIYNGEKYDSRLEADIDGWSTSSFDASDWFPVKEVDPPKGQLMPLDGPPIKRIEEISAKQIFTSPSGKTLIDFGQNLVGWLSVTVQGPAGTNVTFHHAEVIVDGELALEPLRTATQEDSIILHGNGTQNWEPKFTYHGFRFVQVDGWPVETTLTLGSIKAIVVHSDMEQTGWLKTSNEHLNKFHANVRWSMKGNFLSVPTDCPQRDERLGWTGDAHAFGPTANYLYNTAGFWRGWHRDVWSEMQRNGTMVPPDFIPIVPPDRDPNPTAVWSDVVVGNPWNLYCAFGDLVMLAEHFPQSRAWIDTGLPRNGVGLWDRSTFQYGDWLDPKAPPDDPGEATTAKHLVADAYLIRMTEILSKAAKTLGDDTLADEYASQHADLTQEFQNAWIGSDSNLANRTQTAYALSITFGLLPSSEALAVAGETLRTIVAENDYLVGTGFAGTPQLGFALRDLNATSDFYAMLLQTEVPSWLYQVVQGATTTWERWDSLLPDGTPNDSGMTSFNHYAFGAVADWMHQVIGGLAPAAPGWKKIDIAPIPGGDITSAEAKFVSPYGEAKSRWRVADDGFHLEVSVPPNSRARVSLPNSNNSTEVGSGIYEFHDPAYVVSK
ncbi:hypothetical protein DL766_000581 [Monosporascus sp. MC13-8B]|uniref:alpha-L-rhamnosidase n=1 Tax=Monosporascus cannonballus TaxID=155416 RepID=A0ABY0GQR7_9PEZI|nr:hypothetical protein DL762_010373 [Monosporascus cannonballus]RYO86978.1 hypothetical protein DL763_006525 [Monosporascus cannonballus]RYP39125.1 hypothetical protein DL766_000581 [Monosporascus sp. MC13-8B]